MDALQRLGIDGWSLLLYLVNYGILFLVLGKFVYKPLTKAMDERSETIRGNLEAAERLKLDFQTEMDRRMKEQDEVIKAMQLDVMRARTDAEAKAKQLMTEAETRREELLEKTHADIAAMKRNVIADVERELLGRIETIVRSVMRDESASEQVLGKSVERAWNEWKQDV